MKHTKSLLKSSYGKDIIFEIENHDFVLHFLVIHGVPYTE